MPSREAAREVLARLGEAEDPGGLLAGLPAMDLLQLWQLADDDQRAVVLFALEPGSARLLVDLTCWDGDQPQLDRVESLLAPLVRSGFEGADRALDLLDEELRTLVLMRDLIVHLRENKDDDVPAREGSELVALADGYYFIEIPVPEAISDVRRGLLGALTLREFAAYQPELEAVRHELPSELAEQEYRWRAGRLADEGFPPPEEARAVLVPRSVAEFERWLERERPAVRVRAGESRLPVVYEMALGGSELLEQARAWIEREGDDETRNRLGVLEGELGQTIGCFLVAIGAELGNPEAVARDVLVARDLLTLGLQEVSGGVAARAGDRLAWAHPTLLLQVGLGVLAPLRRRARALFADHRLASGGRRGAAFDETLRAPLELLTREVPLRYLVTETSGGAAAGGHRVEIRGFERREEISAAEELLAEAEQLPWLLFERLQASAPLPAETPASVVVATALANAAAGREASARGVPAAEALTFAAAVNHEDPAVFERTGRAAILGLAGAGEPADADRRRLVERLVRLARQRLAEGDPAGALLISETGG